MRFFLLAMLVCCSIATGVWYFTAQRVNPVTFEASNEIKRDVFTEHLYQGIKTMALANKNHTRTVIFDNDAATDDALALVLIGNDPSISLKAITIAGTGEAHGNIGAKNMAAIAYLLGKSEVPIAYGHARPLSSAGKSFPNDMRTAMDHLLTGSNIKPHPAPHITDNAVQLIRQIVEKSPDKITILATGPLTNIAEFVTQYPKLTHKIEKIVIMGGAVNVPGNIRFNQSNAKNETSEWNFYADPEAAHRVFRSHIPITLVALDATNQVPMTRKFYDVLAKENQPDLHLVSTLLKNLLNRYGDEAFERNIYLWDALAAMVLLDPAMVKTKSMPLIVDPTNGHVKIAQNGDKHTANIDVVTKILRPEAALSNYIAMVKSNHTFAQRKFQHDIGRVRAQLGRVHHGAKV
jgi:inosine-uridine nucleoside N-ribohydrolase